MGPMRHLRRGDEECRESPCKASSRAGSGLADRCSTGTATAPGRLSSAYAGRSLRSEGSSTLGAASRAAAEESERGAAPRERPRVATSWNPASLGEGRWQREGRGKESQALGGTPEA